MFTISGPDYLHTEEQEPSFILEHSAFLTSRLKMAFKSVSEPICGTTKIPCAVGRKNGMGLCNLSF